MVEVQVKTAGSVMIIENLVFFSLLKNEKKKFKNKTTRSSTFKNRVLQNFIKRLKK